jgi:hypothetical protein
VNGKQYLVALIGVVLVIMSLTQQWRPQVDAVIFGT